MFLTRWEYYTDLDVQNSRRRPVDVVRRGLEHSAGRIEVNRGQEGCMGSNVGLEREELVAGGVVDVQCSRVEAVGGDGEEDPAARGGDDAA